MRSGYAQLLLLFRNKRPLAYLSSQSVCNRQGSTCTKSKDLGSRASEETLRAICTLIPEKEVGCLCAKSPRKRLIASGCEGVLKIPPEAPARICRVNAFLLNERVNRFIVDQTPEAPARNELAAQTPGGQSAIKPRKTSSGRA